MANIKELVKRIGLVGVGSGLVGGAITAVSLKACEPQSVVEGQKTPTAQTQQLDTSTSLEVATAAAATPTPARMVLERTSTVTPAIKVTVVNAEGAKTTETTSTQTASTAETTSTSVESSVTATSTTTTEARSGAERLEKNQLAKPIPVPLVISGDMVRSLTRDGRFPRYQEGRWMLPAYDETEADAAHNWRGVGPRYPFAFENIDPDAAALTTHGNVGELIVTSRRGGRVMVAVMQLDKHQKEGAWGKDPKTGRFEQNSAWEMQYNFHGLKPGEEIWVVDPDTGKILTWPDGSPVIYRANEQGIAAFEIPATHGNHDVRVGFVFNMPAQGNGMQPTEVKIERGPNDHPELKGENPLPRNEVIKPRVAEK
ncbi:hypothetical protein M1615_04140 [Patescibacteria group bacterium]|nr:hypothetical protein [Patescibacteria group bacterium]MCL5010583.1 hypothetical protein [Patescibacteria group bacterium]